MHDPIHEASLDAGDEADRRAMDAEERVCAQCGEFFWSERRHQHTVCLDCKGEPEDDIDAYFDIGGAR